MKKIKILGINITDRIKESGRTQTILTQYAHCIRTRLGFHEVNESTCSRNGFLLLELKGDEKEWEKLEEELYDIGGIKIKQMMFNLD